MQLQHNSTSNVILNQINPKENLIKYLDINFHGEFERISLLLNKSIFKCNFNTIQFQM